MLWSRSRLAWAAALLAAVLTATIIAFVPSLRQRPNGAASSGAHPATGDYVDSAVCADCHQDIAETYRKTGMGRSFFRPSLSNAVEDYKSGNTVNHQPSGLHYTMLERNGEFFQRRSQAGFGGKETNVMEERIDYVIGSGNHSRTYLHRAADGQLIELPVSWYAERSGYWAMSPGYDWKGQSDFRRAITPECMFCHNGYPEGDVGLDRSIFPERLPEGIDCQRCHGPGKAHVEAAKSAHPTEELVRSTIVNPAHLSRERQMEVCMQCHLETSHHQPNEQRAFDRTVFSYRPGEPLEDYKSFFEPPSAKDDDAFEIAHAAYRLRKSACFRGSQMTCLTCHDPHDIPRGQEAVDHYTEVCMSCHRQVAHTVALPAKSTCMSCHMPKRRTDDAVHVVMTDHFIRRTQPKRDLLAPIAETVVPEGSWGKISPYYLQEPSLTPTAQISLSEAQMIEKGTAPLQELLERYKPAAPEPYLVLAKAYEREGNYPETVRWAQRALLQRKDFRPAIAELVPALFAIHQESEASRVLEQAVEHYPADDLLLSDLGNAYLRQGQTQAAAEMLQRAVQANPDRSESHNLLGQLAMQQGDMVAAEREFRGALRCQPNFAEADDGLGATLVAQHRYDEAAFSFEQAIAAEPENAEAHHHLGRVLVLLDQLPRAIIELRTAASEAPKAYQAHEDLADVLSAAGKPGEAITEYRLVLELVPNLPQAHLGLGMTLLALHQPAEARPHLEAALQGPDPEVAQTAQRLLEQVSR